MTILIDDIDWEAVADWIGGSVRRQDDYDVELEIGDEGEEEYIYIHWGEGDRQMLVASPMPLVIDIDKVQQVNELFTQIEKLTGVSIARDNPIFGKWVTPRWNTTIHIVDMIHYALTPQ